MTFSNSFRLDNSEFIYGDILGAAAQLGANSGVSALTSNSSQATGSTLIYGTSNLFSTPNAKISSDGYISFGLVPPSAYGNNVGIWLGYVGAPKMSLYSNVNNYLQWDGSKLLVKSEHFSLDSLGNITATDAILSGIITATAGYIGGWEIEANQLSSDTNSAFINSATPAIGLGAATDFMVGTGFFVGKNSGTYKLHVGNPSANSLNWDGENLNVIGRAHV